MRNLLYLLIRFSALFLFLFLEVVSFYLIVNYNKSQKEIWAHSSNQFSGFVNKRVEGVEDFFEMQNENDSLLLENAKLLETIINYRVSSKDNAFEEFEIQDTSKTYHIIPARICSKTINLRNNYLTLCSGSANGITPGMGVITKSGIVGIVKTVTKKYATVLMILHSESRISAKINSKNYHGNLIWNAEDPLKMSLMDVPKHAKIDRGDSISTSGFSTVFPPDIFIGRINALEIEGGSNSYKLEVLLNYDLSALEYVYVVSFDDTEEKKTLLEQENE